MLNGNDTPRRVIVTDHLISATQFYCVSPCMHYTHGTHSNRKHRHQSEQNDLLDAVNLQKIYYQQKMSLLSDRHFTYVQIHSLII